MPAELPRSECTPAASSGAPLRSRHFVVPKLGESDAHCQDSVAVRNGSNNESDLGTESLFAVSDGATESFCPRDWAQALTRQFIDEPKLCFHHWNDWLSVPRKKWLENAEQARQAIKPEFLLFHENALRSRRPAAATFVGLWIRHNETGSLPWRALVLGDSALFHLRADGTVLKYGLKRSADYGGIAPMALSYSSEKSAAPRHLNSHFADNGEAPMQPGDVMLLATDALAKWLLEHDESGAPVWGALLRLQTQEDFADFIKRARTDASLSLNNDDTSLIVVSYGEPHGIFVAQKFEPAGIPMELTPLRELPGRPPIILEKPEPLPPPRLKEEIQRFPGSDRTRIVLVPDYEYVPPTPLATDPVSPARENLSTQNSPEPPRRRRSKITEWLSSNMPVVGLNLAFLFLISFVTAFDNSLFQYLSFGVNLLAIFLIAYLDFDAVSLSQELANQTRLLEEQKRLAEEQRLTAARRVDVLEGSLRQALDGEKKRS